MGTPRITTEYKEPAVHQITERGYSVAKVYGSLGVSPHSLYKWIRTLSPHSHCCQYRGRFRVANHTLLRRGLTTPLRYVLADQEVTYEILTVTETNQFSNSFSLRTYNCS